MHTSYTTYNGFVLVKIVANTGTIDSNIIKHSSGQYRNQFGVYFSSSCYSPVAFYISSSFISLVIAKMSVLGFEIEWYDRISGLLNEMFLKYYLDDNTMEILQQHSAFLKRIYYPEVTQSDLFIGNTLTM